MTSQPNRAQRRAMKKAKPIAPARIVPLPALVDEFTVFDIPQRILDQLNNNTIDVVENEDGKSMAVFRDNAGVLTEVCPAMLGWVETWEMISEKLCLHLNFVGLKFLCTALNRDECFPAAIVTVAQLELAECRRAFRTSNRKEIVRIAKMAQLKILIEEKTHQPNQ